MKNIFSLCFLLFFSIAKSQNYGDAYHKADQLSIQNAANARQNATNEAHYNSVNGTNSSSNSATQIQYNSSNNIDMDAFLKVNKVETPEDRLKAYNANKDLINKVNNKPNDNSGFKNLELYAQISSTLKSQCLTGNCVNGFSKIKYGNGTTYEGDFINGIRTGIASVVFPDGAKANISYANNFREGNATFFYPEGYLNVTYIKAKLFGKATFVYNNGDSKEYYLNNGKINGRSIYRFANGKDLTVDIYDDDKKVTNLRTYKGSYSYPGQDLASRIWIWDNDLNDKKYITTAAGDFYCGEKSGKDKHGKGLYVWPDGTQYNGKWRNNNATGQGKIIWATGDVYIGECKKSVAHGKGIFYFIDAYVYDGEMVDGLKEGFGHLTAPNGKNYYEGNFKNNLYNGKGKIVFGNKFFKIGSWKNGELIEANYFNDLNQEITKVDFEKINPYEFDN